MHALVAAANLRVKIGRQRLDDCVYLAREIHILHGTSPRLGGSHYGEAALTTG